MPGRQDLPAAALCIGEFLKATMRLCIYLEGDFAPYWKWLPWRFRRVPWAADFVSEVDALVNCNFLAEQSKHIEEICHLAEAKLAEDGIDIEIDA
jgi:hypothetical protein